MVLGRSWRDLVFQRFPASNLESQILWRSIGIPTEREIWARSGPFCTDSYRTLTKVKSTGWKLGTAALAPGGGPVAGAQGPLLRILQDFLGCYYVYPERKEVGWIEEGKES